MSHNKITVGGQSPSSSGDVSLALNNLSDVDTTGVASGDVIAYNSTSSNYEASSASISLGVVFLGEGASSNYPQTLNASDNVYFYAPNPVNTVGATLLDSDTIGSNWYDGVTLPAGEYIISCSLHGDYTGSTGITTFIIKSGSTQIGCFAQDVDGANNSDYPSDASAYVSLSSSTNIVVDITSVTAANSTTTDGQSKRGYLQVIKVG
jgi:hypothetical protein